MTKQEVQNKIKKMLAKHPKLQGAKIEITFKDKKPKGTKQNEKTKKL